MRYRKRDFPCQIRHFCGSFLDFFQFLRDRKKLLLVSSAHHILSYFLAILLLRRLYKGFLLEPVEFDKLAFSYHLHQMSQLEPSYTTQMVFTILTN